MFWYTVSSPLKKAQAHADTSFRYLATEIWTKQATRKILQMGHIMMLYPSKKKNPWVSRVFFIKRDIGRGAGQEQTTPYVSQSA